MNERIEKLYLQALEQNYSNNMAWEELNIEKFAELLVKECAGIVETESERGTDHTITQILKHFGVEE